MANMYTDSWLQQVMSETREGCVIKRRDVWNGHYPHHRPLTRAKKNRECRGRLKHQEVVLRQKWTFTPDQSSASPVNNSERWTHAHSDCYFQLVIMKLGLKEAKCEQDVIWTWWREGCEVMMELYLWISSCQVPSIFFPFHIIRWINVYFPFAHVGPVSTENCASWFHLWRDEGVIKLLTASQNRSLFWQAQEVCEAACMMIVTRNKSQSLLPLKTNHTDGS